MAEAPGPAAAPAATPVPIAAVGGSDPGRAVTGIAEVDRVLGGGLVPGGVVLVGGEPGIGKSTLLLQVAAALSGTRPVLYVTAEESAGQVAERATRIGAAGVAVDVLAEGDVAAVEAVVATGSYRAVVVDSVQTMWADESAGAVGGVAQVREVASRLTALARRSSVPVVLVGHVTKDGALAGPKVIEHLVDAVLYLEGDSDRGLRYLRSLKNRYGSVAQVGVFEMTGTGMAEVPDPSRLFVGDATGSVAGTVVYPAWCGKRVLLVEVQALVLATSAPQPRRSVTGLPVRRVHQILAVLDRHVGLDCAKCDVFVSVVGGLSIDEPAADLAAALAVASSRSGRPVGAVGAMGEIGLAGEVRMPPNAADRLAELARFGVDRVLAGGGGRLLADVVTEVGMAPTRPHLRVAER